MADVALTMPHVKRPLRGRFAPSPTGRMHAGNIYAALVTWLMCKATDGEVVLRIEDLDRERSRQEYIDTVCRDFENLGLTWDEGPYFQHDRDEAYQAAFSVLEEKGLLYPCFCTRADLKAASAPHATDHWVYPGTCRNLSVTERQSKHSQLLKEGRVGPAWRVSVPTENDARSVDDLLQGPYTSHLATECGDFIVRRSDGAYAYQLAVVVDDAAQGINFVSRGIDLLPSAPQQRYLQHLLELPETEYAHVPLLVAADGRRLAKRNKDAALDQLLVDFGTPAGVIGHIAFMTGLSSSDEPMTPDQLLSALDWDTLYHSTHGIISCPFSGSADPRG